MQLQEKSLHFGFRIPNFCSRKWKPSLLQSRLQHKEPNFPTLSLPYHRRPQGFCHRANVSVQARKYRIAFTCRGVGRRKTIAIIPPPTATQLSQWPFAGAVFTATSEQCASRSVVTSRQALAKLALIADGMMELAEPRQDRTSSIEKRYCFLGRQQLNYPHLW